LEQAAEKNGRSLAQELLFRLDASFDKQPIGPKELREFYAKVSALVDNRETWKERKTWKLGKGEK
jgi:hypothetical protein